MKTWIKRTLIAAVSASALFGGGMAAWAHQQRGHGMHALSDQDAAVMKASLIEKAGKHLDLDASQKAKLGLLFDAIRDQHKALLGASGNPRADFAALLAGPTFDRASANALIQSKVSAVQIKSPAVVTAFADFYDGLNATQQGKLRDFMARRGHRAPGSGE